MIFTLANISFPGSINFIGEFLVLVGFFMKNMTTCTIVMFLLILSTAYALWLYSDISVREFSILTYLLFPMFFLGLNPSPLLKVVEMDFSKILNSYS